MDSLAEIRAIYLDECDEFTGLLEGHLAAMAEKRASTEDINGAFRAVHSIKGGAGAFGLTALVEFSHGFEACLDAMRSGLITMENAPVDLLLQASDELISLVAAARSGEPYTINPAIKTALEAAAASRGLKPSAQTKVEVVQEPEAAPSNDVQTVQIRITPDADMFRRALDPRTVFETLANFGSVEIVGDASGLPPLERLDPLDCHLAWLVTITTATSPYAIAEALDAFLADNEYSLPEERTLASLDDGASDPLVAFATVIDDTPETGDHRADHTDMHAASAAQAPGRRAGGGTIRVDLDRIDKLMNLVGEIVITQSMITERATTLPKREAALLVDALFSLNRQTRELQENVMAVRAQPVKVVFQRLPRLIRELERSLGKRADLKLAGEDTEVDKTIVEELADPLTHMIRNAMDHGLESPEDRLEAGKPAHGIIHVSAEHRGSRILICVSDDGRGIDRERLLDKARQRDLVAADADMTPEDIDNLIFHPGLSTAVAVTEVSGRGVGMDVVRRNIEALGGRITVESSPGRGCRFTLGLPLTLAVLDGMIVRAGTERFVFPLSSIVETVQLEASAITVLPGGGEIARLREDVAPLLHLRDVLGLHGRGHERNVVIVETDTIARVAIAVDEIIGQQQVVVKNLESSFRRVDGVSAATILGDGLVALILDVDGLLAMSHFGGAPSSAAVTAPLELAGAA